jgi:hypothetical protein
VSARKEIYDAIPVTLDAIHAQTDARIRIYSREGNELWDRQTAKPGHKPGKVLKEARNARLRDAENVRKLTRRYQDQIDWHNALPGKIVGNPKITADAAQRLLEERAKLRVVDDLKNGACRVAQIENSMRSGLQQSSTGNVRASRSSGISLG